MDCDKVKKLLSRFIDDQLGAEDRAAVEKHLESCPDCTAYYEQLLALGRMADDFDLGGDESYWEEQKDAVLDRIEKLESDKVVPVTKRSYRGLIYKVAAVAASIALIAYVSIYELKETGPGSVSFKSEKTIEYRSVEPTVKTPPVVDADADTVSGRMLPELFESVRISKRDETVVNEKKKTTVSDEGEEKVRIEAPKPVEIGQPAPKMTVDELKELGVEAEIAKEADEPTADADKGEDTKGGRREKQAMPDVADGSVKQLFIEVKGADTPVEDIGTQALPKDVLDESMARLQHLSVDSEKDSGPSVDEYMARYDVEMQSAELNRRGVDPELFDGYTTEEVALYINSYDKANQLKEKYIYVLTAGEKSGRMSIATASKYSATVSSQKSISGGLSGDSLSIVIRKMADAFHRLGMVTPSQKEREDMQEYLEILKKQADSGTVEEIRHYIDDLESATK